MSIAVCAHSAAVSAQEGPADQAKSSGRAHVEDSFGLGADATLAGLGGISVRYQASRKAGLQSILAYARSSYEDAMTGDDVAETGLFVAVRGDYRLKEFAGEDLHVGAMVGIDLYHTVASTGAADSSDSRFALEGGLKAEYHPTRYFSVHVEAGLVLALMSGLQSASVIGVGTIVGADEPFQRPGGGMAVDGDNIVLGLGETTASAGFTLWFR